MLNYELLPPTPAQTLTQTLTITLTQAQTLTQTLTHTLTQTNASTNGISNASANVNADVNANASVNANESANANAIAKQTKEIVHYDFFCFGPRCLTSSIINNNLILFKHYLKHCQAHKNTIRPQITISKTTEKAPITEDRI